ncbi:hypothetical protein RvY_05799 [Ramazzottius varieornatus]|uniref:HMG box-containing protein 1 n=1 Tax=Ramazzottius varieornatus TaxID=947166 RepID=A0A1D1UZW6_RAMVA|nr:hypothetical protein RvY_05799 [Ramazzottius varieornatus]
MASSSSAFSPRFQLPSTPSSASSLHRPWEQQSTPSSCSSDSASSTGSSFPFCTVSMSAPTTPAGITLMPHLFAHVTASNQATQSRPAPLGPVPSSPLFTAMSPFPAAAVGHFLTHFAMPSTPEEHATFMAGAALPSSSVPSSPSNPSPSPQGNPFSPYHNAPWSAPYTMQSFPLPSMPFNVNRSSNRSPLVGRDLPTSYTNPRVSSPTITQNTDQTSNHRNGPSTLHISKSSSAKKKRKPPPIQIDSSINNFQADTAHLHTTSQQPRTSNSILSQVLGTPSALMSPLAMNSFPVRSPAGHHPLSMAQASPLFSAHLHYQMYQQQMMEQQVRLMQEGAFPMQSPLPSSGFGSVESQVGFPTAINFACLCFLPGTKVKLLSGRDNPASVQWRLVEELQRENFKDDFGRSFRLNKYIKSDNAAGNSVELSFKPVDLSGNLEVMVLCTPYHPFFSCQKGWLSFEPQTTREMYGIACQPFRVSDVVSVNPPPIVENPWDTVDTNASNVLAEWAMRNRRAMSLESVNEPRNWNPQMGPSSASAIPREPKVKVKKEKKEKVKDLDKVKRPMNAFMLFAKDHRNIYTQQYPGRDNRAISIELGHHWKSLTSAQRQTYTDKAKKLADEHKEKNPDCWKRNRSRSRSDSDVLGINNVHIPDHQDGPLNLGPPRNDEGFEEDENMFHARQSVEKSLHESETA